MSDPGLVIVVGSNQRYAICIGFIRFDGKISVISRSVYFL